MFAERTGTMAEIATTKVFENEKIVVWEMVLEPGQSSGLHTHSNSYVFHVLEGSTCEVTDKEGKSCGSLTMEPGFTLFFQLAGQELVAGDFRIPVTHSARNLGDKRFREILIETK
jgi:beta-alanine degradation protein BauB